MHQINNHIKSTNRLGLSIIEINSSLCSTGRNVRDIIGEALKLHRISTKINQNARNIQTKTIIVFEEIDALQTMINVSRMIF